MIRRISLAFTCLLLTACPSIGSFFSNDGNGNTKPTIAVTVTGQLTYQDRVYNSNGFVVSDQPMKAIRNVPVTLLDTDSNTVATTVADANGDFSLTDVPEGNYILRVTAQSDHSSGTRIFIRSTTGQVYGIEQAVTISQTQNHLTFEATLADRVAGIFNMLDVMTLGLDFVATLSLNHSAVNDLNVFWQWGQSDGTYTCRTASIYCASGAGIYVLSDPSITHDTDEFDDDVLWHEFAHHLESSWGMWDSPGGSHLLTSRALDLRLSWSEGMASAFALSLKKWLRASAPERMSIANDQGEDYTSYYIDTLVSGAQIHVDLFTASSSYFRYVTNEAAVASGILRLQAQNGISITWQQLFNSLTENSTADTMDAFWDAMVGGLQPDSNKLESWQATLATKKINYVLDEFETDDSINSARVLLPDEVQTHTLYRNHYSVDEDWFQVFLNAGSTYTIETFNLNNGADTDMALYDAAFNFLDSNDDATDCDPCSPLHDSSHFSSMLTYTAAKTATYFIKIRTTSAVYLNPVEYGYIGRYGGYSIRLSEL